MTEEPAAPSVPRVEDVWKIKVHADFCSNNKQYQEAADLYTKAIEFNPFNAVFCGNLDFTSHILENYNNKQVVKLGKNYWKAQYKRAVAYMALGKFKEAQKDLKQVTEKVPSFKIAFDRYRECNEIVEMIQFERSMGVNQPSTSYISTKMTEEPAAPSVPRVEDVWKIKVHADFCSNNKQYQEAADLYTKAIEFNPFNAVFCGNLDFTSHILENYKSEQVVKLDKNYWKAQYRRAVAYMALGKFKEAQKDLKRVTEKVPSFKIAFDRYRECNEIVEMIQFERSMGVNQPSTSYISTKMTEEPAAPSVPRVEDVWKIKVHADFCSNNKQYQEAADLYTKAIEFNPFNAVFCGNLDFTSHILENYKSEQVVKLDKNYWKAQYRRAVAYMALGKFKEAQKDLKRVTEKVPSFKIAFDRYRECNEIVEMIQFERSMGVNQPSTSYISTKMTEEPAAPSVPRVEDVWKIKVHADFCSNNKQYQEAADLYTKAIEFNPLNDVFCGNQDYSSHILENYKNDQCVKLDKYYWKAHYKRAVAYMALGKFKEAQKDLKRVTEKVPSFKIAFDRYRECNEIVEMIQFERSMGVNQPSTSYISTKMTEEPAAPSVPRVEDVWKIKVHADFCSNNKQYQEAADLYTKAIEFNPLNDVFYGNQDYSSHILENYKNDQCVKLDKYYWKAHYKRAVAYMALGKFKEAQKDLKQVTEKVPSFKIAFDRYRECNEIVEMIQFERSMGVNQPSTSYISTKMTEEPAAPSVPRVEDVWKIKVHADFCSNNKQYQEAADLYTKAIEFNPLNDVFYGNQDYSSHILENYKNDQCVKLDKYYWKAHYKRAVAYMALGKFKEAQKDLKQVTEKVPEFKIAFDRYRECNKIVERIQFESAIAVDQPSTSFTAEYLFMENLSIEDNYQGPKLKDDLTVTEEFVQELIESYKSQKLLHKKYAYKILLAIKVYLMNQPTLINIKIKDEDKVTICGDIHGQYYDLCNIFETNGMPSVTNVYLFNGDYVDRGSFGVECIFVLFAFKLLYPDHFFLVRGNHESVSMNRLYGFEGEVKAKYNSQMFDLFTEVYNWLPLAHCINDKVLVMHGGLFAQDNVTLDDIRQLPRNMQPPHEGIMCDLLWSNPHPMEGRCPSKRGVGIQFGPDVTGRFLEQNNLLYIVRSHDVKPMGYEVAHDGKCITVFSAPNYCDKVGNSGAYLTITGATIDKPNFVVFNASPHPDIKPMADANPLIR